MIIDGEKWACEACVRGHRVSNCQHADRPLQHINKKGRPVSQCQHCRAMRKSRSSHIKCDCGEKTHKCAHLQTTIEGHRDSCCCNHGGRCTCCHKKEAPQLDTVPESDSDEAEKCSAGPKAPVRRRRANTAHSDGILSLDEYGHHRPTYKHSKTSSKCGPYPISRVNSVPNGTTRSVDSLFRSEPRRISDSSTGLAGTSRRRGVKSEAASPSMSSTRLGHMSQLPPLDLSAIEYPSYPGGSFDMFGGFPDQDQALFSAGLSATSVDWSHYDIEFNASKIGENFAPSNYSQTQSYGGLEFNGSEQAPTLTTATSGEVSEVEDFMGPCLDDFDPSTAFGRASTASSGYNLSTTQAGLLSSADLASAYDFDDLKAMKAGSKYLPTPGSIAGEDASGYSFVENDPSLWMNEYASGLPYETTDPSMAAAFWDTQ